MSAFDKDNFFYCYFALQYTNLKIGTYRYESDPIMVSLVPFKVQNPKTWILFQRPRFLSVIISSSLQSI